MKSIRPAAFVIGLAAFLVAHVIEKSSWAAFGGTAPGEPWFLNANRAVLFTMVCAAIAGFISARGTARTEAAIRGLNAAAGATAAMIAVLVASGGSSLFPIVIATGIGVVLIGSLIGALIATALGRP